MWRIWDMAVLAISTLVGLALITFGGLLAWDGVVNVGLTDADFIIGTGVILVIVGGLTISWGLERIGW